MNQISNIRMALLLTGILSSPVSRADTPLQKQSIIQLEQRRDAITAEVNQLADYSLRSGVGAIGYRSQSYTDPHHTEWIQIDLGEESPIDQIVLVPYIWRTTQSGFKANGFPSDFRILAGLDDDPHGTVIASFSDDDSIVPRIAPLIIDFPETTASWVRLETDRLSPRLFDNKYDLELAEFMVFSGADNIALRQPVSTPTVRPPGPRSPIYLVDGFVPYLMNAAQGEKSIAFINDVDPKTPSILTLDLGQPYSLSRIHLHAVDQSDTVPQYFPGDLGIPRQMHIEGANTPDFSDAVLLLDLKFKSVYETGPMICRRFQPQRCRYVRMTATAPYTYIEIDHTRSRFGFAEIELFSEGINVALDKPFTANFKQLKPDRFLTSLTDGRNFYGTILPLKRWMNELARRHDLEREQPLITAALNTRYAQQKKNLQRMGWLVALLTVGIGFTILGNLLFHQRQAARLRERFAADLHDELGANLHAIGILGTHAETLLNSPEKLQKIVREIKDLTLRAGDATQRCVQMQTAKELHTDLSEEMQRAARNMIANLTYDLVIEDENILNSLKPRTRSDLFLFFKEGLINILRHANASDVNIKLTATKQDVSLRITDNGCGIQNNSIPKSLKRRAKLLKGNISTDSLETGGTRITLSFKTKIRHT